MIFKPKNVLAALSAAAMVVALGSQAQAQQRYTVGSLAEGTTPFIVNTAWANAINKYMPGHKVQVSAVGAATKHAILVAQGKMDFSMKRSASYSPIRSATTTRWCMTIRVSNPSTTSRVKRSSSARRPAWRRATPRSSSMR
jgi:hypothetical protein